MADLVIQEAYHLHDGESPALTQLHDLVVADAYHLNKADSCNAAYNIGWTDGLYPPKLPVLELTAQGENLISGLDDGSKLPLPELTIRAGARCGNEKLSDLGISAAGSADLLASLSKKIPTLRLTGAASLKPYGSLSKSISSIKVSDMTGHRSSIDVSVNLPTIIMESVGTGDQDGQGAGLYNSSRFTDYVLRYSR